MNKSEIEFEIKKALGNVSGAFQKDELAFLALTSKPELQFRDRLAFQLHEQLRDRITVAREWKRVDLAFLNGNEPQALIQLKALSLFKFISESPSIEKTAYKDIKKCGERSCKAYSLIIATHIESDFLPEQFYASYKGVVKYLKGWRKAFSEYESSFRLEQAAAKKIRTAFFRWRLADSGKIPAGSVFGVRVSVLYWLYDPN